MIRHNRANAVLYKPLLLALDLMVLFIRINGAVVHNSFIACGAIGAALLLYYKTRLLIPSAWYLLIDIPLFAVGWLHVGRRFFFLHSARCTGSGRDLEVKGHRFSYPAALCCCRFF